MQKAVIIINPKSRSAPSLERLQEVAASMLSDGWEIEVKATEHQNHATELAHDAAVAGLDAVVACGGDGTINEVINGLANTPTALAVLRGGMGNVFAKEIGVKRAHEQAIRVLVDGDKRRFDLGLANERHFMLMAGVGFDAAVVRRVPSAHKRLLGSTSYGVHGVIELTRYKAADAKVVLDGEPWQGDLFWGLFGNTRSYGGVINITSKARVDDGLLEGYVFEGQSARWLASTAAKLVRGVHHQSDGVIYRRLHTAVVETPGLPIQADGEYFGETPVSISVAPAALDVLLPSTKAQKLFGG